MTQSELWVPITLALKVQSNFSKLQWNKKSVHKVTASKNILEMKLLQYDVLKGLFCTKAMAMIYVIMGLKWGMGGGGKDNDTVSNS